MSPEEATTQRLRQEREKRVRSNLLRSVIIWTPPFVLCLGLLVFFTGDQLFGDERGSWFLVAVLVIGTVLFGSQSIQAILDLLGPARDLEGEVTRRWSRADSLVVRTHYMRIGKSILRGDRDILDEIKTGDHVKVNYYPHSGIVIAVDKREAPKVQAPGPGDGDRDEAGSGKAPAPALPEAPRVRNRRTVEPPKF